MYTNCTLTESYIYKQFCIGSFSFCFCHVFFCFKPILNKAGYTATEVRAGGQGPYLRSQDHLGRRREVSEIKS